MKLSEIKGEAALDVLADIIEPIAEIAMDAEVREMRQAGKPRLLIVKQIIKAHKEALIQVLAALDMKTVEEYKETVSLVTLPLQVMEMLNDEQVSELFGLQSQTEKTSFGSAMENTEAQEA